MPKQWLRLLGLLSAFSPNIPHNRPTLTEEFSTLDEHDISHDILTGPTTQTQFTGGSLKETNITTIKKFHNDTENKLNDTEKMIESLCLVHADCMKFWLQIFNVFHL